MVPRKCTNCHAQLKGKALLRVELDDVNVHAQIKGVDGGTHHAQGYACQSCGTTLDLVWAVELVSVRVGHGRATLAARTLEEFKKVVVRRSRSQGLNPPTNVPAYFLRFLERRQPFKPSSEALARCQKRIPASGDLDFVKAQGIVMISTDGKPCMFVEEAHLESQPAGPAPTKQASAQPCQGSMLDHLINTRFGLVPPENRLFLAALEHSLGARGRKMPNHPLRPRH